MAHALPWLAGSYPLGTVDDLESGIFGFLMKNWIDSAKKIRVSPKFAVRGQTDSSDSDLILNKTKSNNTNSSRALSIPTEDSTGRKLAM